jgi:uncharacterized protein YjbI with pentapeptide repeats
VVATNLTNADLSEAKLQNADLSSAEVIANPQDAPLRLLKVVATNLTNADLSEAKLQNADLSSAVLQNANLTNADLTDANLDGATGITNEELEQQAGSLEGATMPNGQKYEEWRKDKQGNGKDVENE